MGVNEPGRDDQADILRKRRHRQGRTSTRPAEGVVPRLVEVKGIGRHGNRGRCDDCGHPIGRCICHSPDPDLEAA